MTPRSLKLASAWVLGARLLASRQLAGKTQKEMAELLGISATALGKYESGDTEPPLAALVFLSGWYGDTRLLLLDDLMINPEDIVSIDYEAVRIGYRLQFLRGGRSVAWAAQRLGVEYSNISAFEDGAAPLSHDHIKKLAAIYGVEPLDITGKKPIQNRHFPNYTSLIPGGAAAQFPPHFEVEEQEKICIPTEELIEHNVGDPRVMFVHGEDRLLPYWGIFPGDGVVCDSAVTSYDLDGVYVIHQNNNFLLRAIIKRGNLLWFEPELGSSDPEPVPPQTEICGRVFYRAGSLIK
jgi:transcriptional regulator with XRE-family HTH domain